MKSIRRDALRALAAAALLAGTAQTPAVALTQTEEADYLAGKGMGYAKPAELNHYPGPSHVLELADRLGLDAVQRARTQALFDSMHNEAKRLGERIVTGERELETLFATARIDMPTLERRIDELAELQRRLRLVHLRAHLDQRAILTADQVQRYDALRGHAAPPQHHHH